ncbi:unnamed protein product [Clonostachys rosea f. rosea IK726]|uniref:NADP-dependent oxidoreductase domain-containing protein n=2 Tax=Bionectria ochroleuca TaxID=29856 RepID=A0A0B7K8V8_BIOOC|nr:unnamed protein product [Clonostachys rosea f. rosea IK726]
MSQPRPLFNRLSQDAPRIPRLGLGLMGMSLMYGPTTSDSERFAVLDRALDLGANHWDSADMYNDNEELIGKWFKRTGKRDQIFLATKFGIVKNVPDYSKVDSSAAYCRKACEESLRILGTDYIDLYYMHRANPETPIEETVRAMAELKAEGKIKHIGLSEITASTLRRACKVAQIDAIQVEYSAFVLDIENTGGILETARELGVTVVAYSPLGRGILTGNLSQDAISSEGDFRPMFPMYAEENLQKNRVLLDQLGALAGKKGCTTAQLAIAWLLKQGDDIVPIPGTKRIKYLEENFGALRVQLSDTEESEIRKIIKNVAGGRAPDWAMAALEANTREE